MSEGEALEPGRLMALLWKKAGASGPSARGRPSRLDLRQIVEAAVSLADAAGLDRLTMRTLAHELGSSPMALYNHVPGRRGLLVLMLDHCYATMDRREPGAGGWRVCVEAVARDHFDLILRHPWIAELPATRPALGPGQAAKYDRDLAALDGLALDVVELDRTLAAILELASGAARQAVAAQRERLDSGMSDEAWWGICAPYYEKAFEPERYPLAARIGSAAAEATGGAYDPEAVLAQGLMLMLNGLNARVVTS